MRTIKITNRRIATKIAMLMCFLLFFIFTVNAQNLTLNMKDVQIKTVMKEIQQQSDFKFVYNDSQVDLSKKISVKISNKSIRQALDEIFVNNDIVYKIIDKQIILSPREFKRDKTVKSQGMHTVKGKINDEVGVPLAGAFICIKGDHSRNALATENGDYTINANKNDILVYTFLGMKECEVAINGKSVINVVMESNMVSLEDVVVTGYQTINRGHATGSFELLSSKDFNNTIVSNNFVDKLEGIVPGLAIDSNGDMMIRGQATIYAETKPLVVVDGFPMEYGTSNINPNDIENISVLKDAASASIWGVRAANGVVVITTKRGEKNQKTSVTYTGNLKIGSKFDLESLGYLTSQQHVEWEREKFANLPTEYSVISASNPLNYSDAAFIEYRYQNGQISDSQKEQLYTELGSYDNLKDIQKYFYQRSLLQTHNITVMGGTQSITNYLSVNFENSLGDLKGNKRNKAGLQLNSTFEISKRIKLSTAFRANYSNNDAYTGTPINMLPYTKIKDEAGNYVNQNYGYSQLMKADLESKGYVDWSYNNLKDRSMTDNNTKSYNVSASAMLDIDLFKGLKFSTSGMYIVDHSAQEILYDKDSYYVRNLYNEFTAYDSGVLTSNLPDGAIKSIYNNNSSSFTFRNTLNYNYSGKNFDLSLMGGCEMFAIRTKTQSDIYYGYDPQGMTFNTSMNYEALYGTGVPGFSALWGNQRLYNPPTQADAEDRYFSTFFTGTFSYTDRYTLFGSIRYDKTNLYGRSAKYRDQPTWSVGGKWNISNEKFFTSDLINLLSFKLSYGLSGNVDKTTSPYLIAANETDMLLGLPVLTINNPENPELAWEKVYSFNAGLELAMLSNRLKISTDYYIRNTRDALGNMVIDPTTGWPTIKKNTASLINRGIDLSISGNPVRGKDFAWNSILTFSYNYNEVTKVNSGEETVGMITAGNALLKRPVDYVYAYRNGGLSSSGELQVFDAAGKTYLYNETSGFLPEDLLIMGRRSPKIFGAWTNIFSFKGFELDMLITYKLGHKIHMPAIGNADSQNRIYKTFDKRWRKSGDEAATWIPVAQYDGVSGMYLNAMNNNSKMIEKGDLVRLKSIGLSYDFKRIFKTKCLQALNLKLSVENPYFYAANSDGLDPDRLTSSYDSSYIGDQPAYYTLTLNLKF